MKELCRTCLRKQEINHERLVIWLLRKLDMQEAGCPLARHELKNHEWRWLSVIKDERLIVSREEAEKAKGDPCLTKM